MSCPRSINTKKQQIKNKKICRSIIRYANHSDDKAKVKSKTSVKIYDYNNLYEFYRSLEQSNFGL